VSTPEDRIAAVDQGLRVTRALVAELNTAAHNMREQDPISDVVVATFDGDGYLCDLFIEPTALADFTHTGLEDLITEVLSEGTQRLREVAQAAIDRYWGPESSWQELTVLREDW
jgi:DNA-binding protein YbaB